ncbi:MAG: hypothetical protein ACI83I_001877, partial [Bacteroidia bacterium]
MIFVFPLFFKWLTPKSVRAIALFPVVLFKNSSDRNNPVLINHERIHLHQQSELLVVFFYMIYVTEFLFHVIQLKKWDAAYRAISFEKEAYKAEADLNYLSKRSCFAMWRSL